LMRVAPHGMPSSRSQSALPQLRHEIGHRSFPNAVGIRQIRVLSTVSGGTIIGAYYYLKVKDLLEGRGHRRNPKAVPSRQAYINIVEEIEEDFLREVQTNLRMQLLLNPLKTSRMLLSDDYSRSDRMAELYNEHFYQPLTKNWDVQDAQNIKLRQLKITPKDIQEEEKLNFDIDKYNENPKYEHKIPILTINATSLNTGYRWQFTSSWVGDSSFSGNRRGTRVALHTIAAPDTIAALKHLRLDKRYRQNAPQKPPQWEPMAASEQLENLRQEKLADLTLSDAVAASACVPGIFTPLPIHDLYWNSRGEEIVVELVDGGVFDNQGLDALFAADCTRIICSDASGQLQDSRTPSSQTFPVVSRANDILMARVRVCQALSAECVEMQKLSAEYPKKREFVFFHLRDEFQGNTTYPSILGPAYESDNKTNGHIYLLSNLRTDLDSFTDMEAFTLMYDGYWLCDSRLATRSNAPNLGIGAPKEVPSAGCWKFLKINKIISESPDKLLEHLKVGGTLLFKVFRIAPFWSLFLAAVIATPFIILCRQHFDLLKRLYTCFITYGGYVVVFAIPIGAIFWLLKKLESTNLITKFLDIVRKYRRGDVWYLKYPFAVVGVIGSVIALIHLCVFDPLFRKAGRV
jgi:NTE family protein